MSVIQEELERMLSGYKQVSVAIESIQDGAELTVKGRMAAYGNKDTDGDIVLPGAFAAYIEYFNEAVKKIPRFLSLLYRHRRDMKIGYVKELKEDEQGVIVTAVIDQSTDAGSYVADLVRRKKVTGFSYHFFDGLGYLRDGVRHYTSMVVDEVTLTPSPANELATIHSFKQRKEAYKAWKGMLIDLIKVDGGLSNREARSFFRSGAKSLDEGVEVTMLKIFDGMEHR